MQLGSGFSTIRARPRKLSMRIYSVIKFSARSRPFSRSLLVNLEIYRLFLCSSRQNCELYKSRTFAQKTMFIWKLPFINLNLSRGKQTEIEMECQVDVLTYTACIVRASFFVPRAESRSWLLTVYTTRQYTCAIFVSQLATHVSATLRLAFIRACNQSRTFIK